MMKLWTPARAAKSIKIKQKEIILAIFPVKGY
jgi:hypothetical protein